MTVQGEAGSRCRVLPAGREELWLGERGCGLAANARYRSLRRRTERVGIEGFRPHRLRHTAAHRWLAAGGSGAGLMAMAGWTRVEMLTRYTRVAASERAAAEARRLALMVLVGNELWNVAFFNLRSPGNGFLGVLLFLGPMLSLQKAVSDDRVSVVAWTPYTFWVIGYDVRGSTGSGV